MNISWPTKNTKTTNQRLAICTYCCEIPPKKITANPTEMFQGLHENEAWLRRKGAGVCGARYCCIKAEKSIDNFFSGFPSEPSLRTPQVSAQIHSFFCLMFGIARALLLA